MKLVLHALMLTSFKFKQYTSVDPQSVFDSDSTLDQIALTVAKLHQMNQVPIAKNKKFLLEKIETFKELIERRVQSTLNDFNKKMTDQLQQQNSISFNLVQELDFVRQQVTDCTEPLVFSHNDLNLGSMLWRNDILGVKHQKTSNPRLMLINYDICGFNFRAFDLASWLNSIYLIHLELNATEALPFDAPPFVHLKKILIYKYLHYTSKRTQTSVKGISTAQEQNLSESDYSTLKKQIARFQMISTLLSTLLSLSTQIELNVSQPLPVRSVNYIILNYVPFSETLP